MLESWHRQEGLDFGPRADRGCPQRECSGLQVLLALTCAAIHDLIRAASWSLILPSASRLISCYCTSISVAVVGYGAILTRDGEDTNRRQVVNQAGPNCVMFCGMSTKIADIACAVSRHALG